ncbi:TatD family hydrolase [Mycoplasma sp. 246B]
MSNKKNKFIDAHCHLFTEYYKKEEIENIVAGISNNNIEFIINNGGSHKNNLECINLALKYHFIKACIGIHPESGEGENGYLQVEKLLNEHQNLIVGIGEIGLDYYYEDGLSKEKQLLSFENQIKLANKYNLPAVIHIRDKENVYQAYRDVYEILKKYPNLKCMLHTFAGDLYWAKKFMEFKNLYFSFSGVITFGSADKTRDVIKMLPLDRILTETDSPYLRVHPYRNQINEPITVVYVAYYISGLKSIGMDKFVDRINRNLRKLFNL